MCLLNCQATICPVAPLDDITPLSDVTPHKASISLIPLPFASANR